MGCALGTVEGDGDVEIREWLMTWRNSPIGKTVRVSNLVWLWDSAVFVRAFLGFWILCY